MNTKILIASIITLLSLMSISSQAFATDATAGSIELSGSILYDNQDVSIHLYDLQASKYYTVYSYDGTTTTLLFNISSNTNADDLYLTTKADRPTSDYLIYKLYPQSGSTGTMLGSFTTTFQDPFNMDLIQTLAISALPVVVIVGVLAGLMGYMIYRKKKGE